MAQIFHRSTNTVARVSIYGSLVALLALSFALYGLSASPYYTDVNQPKDQPVPFSHRHHAGELGIDCRYCHTSVEESSFAGIPPTQTCMTCHSQIWTEAAMLAPDRKSLAENTPIRWTRVYTLPDYVYFDHSIHIAKGVGCTECHGPIGDMPMTWKAHPLFMSWCLSCHRDPAPHLRPKDEVFNPHWQRTASTPAGKTLMTEYHIKTSMLSDCGICHR